MAVHAGPQNSLTTRPDLKSAVRRLQLTRLGHAQRDVWRQRKLVEFFDRTQLQIAHDMNDLWVIRAKPTKRLGGFLDGHRKVAGLVRSRGINQRALGLGGTHPAHRLVRLVRRREQNGDLTSMAGFVERLVG